MFNNSLAQMEINDFNAEIGFLGEISPEDLAELNTPDVGSALEE